MHKYNTVGKEMREENPIMSWKPETYIFNPKLKGMKKVVEETKQL